MKGAVAGSSEHELSQGIALLLCLTEQTLWRQGGSKRTAGVSSSGEKPPQGSTDVERKLKVGSAHDCQGKGDNVKNVVAEPRVKSKCGGAGNRALERGDVPGASQSGKVRPTVHKVVWHHSSSRGIGLTSLGEGRRRGSAGGRGDWCWFLVNWTGDL